MLNLLMNFMEGRDIANYRAGGFLYGFLKGIEQTPEEKAEIRAQAKASIARQRLLKAIDADIMAGFDRNCGIARELEEKRREEAEAWAAVPGPVENYLALAPAWRAAYLEQLDPETRAAVLAALAAKGKIP